MMPRRPFRSPVWSKTKQISLEVQWTDKAGGLWTPRAFEELPVVEMRGMVIADGERFFFLYYHYSYTSLEMRFDTARYGEARLLLALGARSPRLSRIPSVDSGASRASAAASTTRRWAVASFAAALLLARFPRLVLRLFSVVNLHDHPICR